MDFKSEISKLLKKEKIDSNLLEIPPTPDMGDFALPCFTLAKEYKKSPNIIAEDLAKKIKPSNSIERIESKGPYLNFYIKKGLFNKEIIESKPKKNKINKTIIVEYSSPNIMKPFNVAHLRSTMIGNSIAKIHKKLGYKVISINHLGDWGTQFGKMIYAYNTWGDKSKLKEDPIKYMLKLYVKFHKEAEKNPKLDDKGREEFAKLEQGDKKSRKLWEDFKKLSLKEYNKTYKKLNVSFDSFDGEAFYEPQLKSTINMLKKKNLLKESEGALIVDLKDYNLTPCIIQKSDGSTIYATRDLAAAIYRAKQYKFDKNLYIVDFRQSLHFQQFFKVLELADYKWAKDCLHIPFGIMKFDEGIMSTRKGKIVFLEDVLDKSVEKVNLIIKEKNPGLKNKDQVAQMVGIGAIVFWDLSHDRIKDINFDWDRILDFNGETGPYVQYTYARASSILRKANNKSKADYSRLEMPEEKELIQHLSLYNDIIEKAGNQYKPSILAKYLVILSQRFNEFYQNCKCIGLSDNSLAKARLNLVSKTRDTLSEGLELLGISTPEEM